jgi:cytochrome c2
MRQTTYFRTTALVLIAMLAGSAHAGGNAAHGADLFRQNCSACHSPEPGQNLVGPSLFSVVGRPAGSIANFSYSAAMKSSGIVWTTDQLLPYLKAPRKYVPGVKMLFPGLSDEKDREDVVSFLVTLRAAPRSTLQTADVPAPRASSASN